MKTIRIIGGGLAGLTLGIMLRRRGIPVTVCEAGQYPRHRVCGEFISGRGLDVLRSLNLDEVMVNNGARHAQTAAFFSAKQLICSRPLPSPALCVSRWVLDAALAKAFVELGGELRTRSRVAVHAEEGAVLAIGRRARPVDQRGARWFGLKIHARNVQLDADLEMHVHNGAYVGLCKISEDRVNVCGLFRRASGEPVVGLESLRGAEGTTLFGKLAKASFDQESFCAVAGLCLDLLPIETNVCRIGDALTMIPPITGNGMSLAFESAAVAADPIAAFARGERSWIETTRIIAAELQLIFSSRLRWSNRLQNALFNQRLREHLLPLVMGTGWGWRKAFALTRN